MKNYKLIANAIMSRPNDFKRDYYELGEKVCFIAGPRMVIDAYNLYYPHTLDQFQSGIWPAEHAQQLQDHFYGVDG